MRAFTFKVVISTYKFGDEIKMKFQFQEQTFHGVSQSPAQSITLLIKRKRGFKHNSKICHLICHEKRFNGKFIFFSDEVLAKVVIGTSSVKETGRAHWAAAMTNPGSRVFMWHEATVNH